MRVSCVKLSVNWQFGQHSHSHTHTHWHSKVKCHVYHKPIKGALGQAGREAIEITHFFCCRVQMQCLTSITRPRPPPPSCLTGHTAVAVARFGEVNSLSQDDPPPVPPCPVPVPCCRSVPCSCGWAYHISKPTNLTIFSLMCAGHGKGIHRDTQQYTELLA